jgi:hypothetical protein
MNNQFDSAIKDGALSMVNAQVLNIPDIGSAIQAGLGINVDDVLSSEVLLVSVLIDDSGSISGSNNEQNIIDGHNLILDSLLDSKQKDNVLIHTRYLNGKILNSFCHIKDANRMDKNNYHSVGGTPLYDETAVLLGTVIKKTQEFVDNGVQVRTCSIILTDGRDEHSKKCDQFTCRSLTEDMFKVELKRHSICAMGIDDGSTNFASIFNSMGITNVLTPGNTASEIRKAFEVASQSAIQSMAVGGFGV